MSASVQDPAIEMPSLPKAGGALGGLGKGWGDVGASGVATFEITLPVSPGRGYAPSLALMYRSNAGKGPFGLGWALPVNAVSRRTSKGVPTYTAQDMILGPEGQPWLPEQDGHGEAVETHHAQFNGRVLDTNYTVVRHFPKVESDFSRIELWRSDTDLAGFWLVQAADGCLHLYGKTPLARIAAPDDPQHVAQWLLQESLNPLGEHIYYHYREETETSRYPRDSRAQRYLERICYGNFSATQDEHLYLWKSDVPVRTQWHFEVVLDYGERTTAIDQIPTYAPNKRWVLRNDPFSSFAYGFELRTLRLCRQVLMFHRFPDETTLGPEPVLVRRLLLEHQIASDSCNLLTGAHEQAIDSSARLSSHPPLELLYHTDELQSDTGRYQPFDALPGLNDGQRYSLADLFGEGLPGVLYRDDKCWYYREPMRASTQPDAIAYGPPRKLPRIPVADRNRPVRQALMDVTGDGHLDWLVVRPGMNGFFSLDSSGNWSGFTPFNALPLEFLHSRGCLADVMGAGFLDFVMIGPRSVRLFANRQSDGFAGETQIAHTVDDDALPALTLSTTELVAFCDVLGSGQQHLVRIRHNELKCWPNLGGGRFGKGFVFAVLPFPYDTFVASRVLLADLNGSGATDLLYLEADRFWVLRNLGGNGFAPRPFQVRWPKDVRYDDHCQVSIVDLQGLGCPSLVLSVAHVTLRHWRYDFFNHRPYLLKQTENNMGARTTVDYRSSAQEWLDEKQALRQDARPTVCQMPLAVALVTRQTVLDEITGSRYTQILRYRQGYYDRREHEFRGYGLVLQSDAELNPADPPAEGYSAPVLTKTWLHTGQLIDMSREGYSVHDPQAIALGRTLLSRHRISGPLPTDHHDDLIDDPDPALLREAQQALSGAVLRVEVFASETTSHPVPFSVQEYRYLVRQLPDERGTRRHGRTLMLQLESISYQYERIADDPVCQHQINLRWDAYGSPVHTVSISHARRKTAGDDPPPLLTDVHQQSWWRDTHDPAQQAFYLSETLAQFIHLTGAQRWRLGLPYRQRSNALMLEKEAFPDLRSEHFCYERLLNERTGPLGIGAKRELSALSIQRYRGSSGRGETLNAGTADFRGLVDHLETAELDPNALRIYADIPQLPPYPSTAFNQWLLESGYHPMALFFSAHQDEARKQHPELWSIRRNFSVYGNADQFYRVRVLRQTEAHGRTLLEYDRYYCQLSAIHLPDGCITRVQPDYRALQPASITDPNGTTQEGLFDGFGQLLACSVRGQEFGKPVGFLTLDQYQRPQDDTPASAISDPRKLLQQAARAHAWDCFSWMGSVKESLGVAQEWVEKGYLLPSGHIRATARLRLNEPSRPLSRSEETLKAIVDVTSREPMHAVQLQADRYSGDEAQQIRISLTCWDGFGRVLQNKQKTEAGPAYAVDESGNLIIFTAPYPGALQPSPTGQIQTVQADTRWRVSERVEYNNKGLTIRVYRPYFANTHRYINDRSLRELGYSDRQFYDPVGRPTRTLTANGSMRRVTYWAWYTVHEDENDTWEEMQPSSIAPGQ
jgi:hypothetical protein